jgi:3-oxoadipate enol-lactonase
VAFLHGFGGNHLSWWQQLPVFAEEYRCIAPDQRGFGLSENPGDDTGAAPVVDDLAALLDHLDVDRVALVGHSMGGWPAASYATQYPERVAALVLSATTGGLLAADRPERLQEEADVPEVDPLTAERSFLKDSISELNVDAPEEWEDIRPSLDELPLDPDRVVDLPTFLVTGEADGFVPPSVRRALSDRLDGIESAVLEDAGHSAYFEQPSAFNRHVSEFLENAAEF